MRPPHKARALVALVLLLAPRADALEVRAYTQAAYNRLLDFPGEPIFPQTPEVNPAFSPAAAGLFLGIGWPAHPTDWTRQMALVSPRHFVYATHYPLGADWRIAFLGADGGQHLYGIESQTPVINTLGQTTDLMLCTLDAEVSPGTGIAPFATLNLAGEADYLDKDMIVFGSFVRAGRIPLQGFINLVNDPGFDTTRFAYFDYNHSGGNPDDCDYQGGDSGAPTFVMDQGRPAIIGTASGRDPQGWGGLPPNVSRNYLAFIPNYLPQLDSLMEAKGYHMIRSRPDATSVQTHAGASGPLRRLHAGTCAVVLTNSGPAEAHNISLQLQFPVPPQDVSGEGAVCEATSPSDWRCRRGGIPAGAVRSFALAWSELPDTPVLTTHVVLSYDGATPQTFDLTVPLLESFASWVQGASDTTEQGDPDHDGLSNLLEYAFGGSPVSPSAVAPDGHPLHPETEVSEGFMRLRYPRRTDAAQRGLSDIVEFSTLPGQGNWSSTPPAGTTFTSAPFTPPVEGFEQVTVSIPTGSARCFARIKVVLEE